jgi:hypothetical protein
MKDKDYGEERVAGVIRESPLCLECIAAQTQSDLSFADIMLQNLDEGGRIIKVVGRCSGCGMHDVTFRSQTRRAGPQLDRA